MLRVLKLNTCCSEKGPRAIKKFKKIGRTRQNPFFRPKRSLPGNMGHPPNKFDKKWSRSSMRARLMEMVLRA